MVLTCVKIIECVRVMYIMQAYRALWAWREAAGQEFEIRQLHQLVDVLRSEMDDIADVARLLLKSKSFTSHTSVIGLLRRHK